MPTRVGVISDTHGLLRPEAVAALRGVDRIVHAGDIGSPEVLERLAAIAPLCAVRGNVDKGVWAEGLPEIEVVEVESAWLYVLHDLAGLDLDPSASEFQAVISGHSHRPLIARDDGVLYVNPGSAGPRRFTLPVALARIEVDGSQVSASIVELTP